MRAPPRRAPSCVRPARISSFGDVAAVRQRIELLRPPHQGERLVEAPLRRAEPAEVVVDVRAAGLSASARRNSVPLPPSRNRCETEQAHDTVRFARTVVESQSPVDRLLRAREGLRRHHPADSIDAELGVRVRDRGVGQREVRVARDRLLEQGEAPGEPSFVNLHESNVAPAGRAGRPPDRGSAAARCARAPRGSARRAARRRSAAPHRSGWRRCRRARGRKLSAQIGSSVRGSTSCATMPHAVARAAHAPFRRAPRRRARPRSRAGSARVP